MKLSKLAVLSLCFYSSALLASPNGSTSSSESHAYIPNRGDNNVISCSVDNTSGALTKCHAAAAGFTVPEGVTVNHAGNLLYVVNNNTLGTVSVCNINANDGALSGCTDAGGSGFYFPDAAAFNSDGSILYVVNASGANGQPPSVSACTVDKNSGKLSDCVKNSSKSLDGPSWIQINSAGNLAYLTNFTANTISVCKVSGKSITDCNNTSGNGFDLPDSVTLNSAGNYAYVTNNKGQGVMVCSVNASTGLLNKDCASTTKGFTGSGLAFNRAGDFAYISNFVGGTVTVCAVDPSNGGLSKCHPASDDRYNEPASIAIK